MVGVFSNSHFYRILFSFPVCIVLGFTPMVDGGALEFEL